MDAIHQIGVSEVTYYRWRREFGGLKTEQVKRLKDLPVAWDDFYKTARWQQLRKFQLMQHPLCKFCLERGIVVVDHVVPHRGDWTDFITGDLQSLCEPCHNSAKRQIELRGYRFDIGLDGYPTDPNHPFYRAG